MKLNLDNKKLRALIPGVIHEVTGETSLYEKLSPWLESACWLLEQEIFDDYQPEGALYTLAEKIAVERAFAVAIPSLDVTLSPAGFAVINTDGRAPASKERVERLIASLTSSADANTVVLLDRLNRCKEWVESPKGQWYRATFLPDFNHLPKIEPGQLIFSVYRSVRSRALMFEQEMAEHYLGRSFMATLRSSYPAFPTDGHREIYELIRSIELDFVRISGKCELPPDPNMCWHMVRPILAQLDYFPELKQQWESEMGQKIKVEPFKNTVKGGFYF